MNGADEILLGFARAVREAGVPVTADRSQAFLDATALVGLGERAATRAAGRATLCGTPDDLERFDRVFEAWFGSSGSPPVRMPASRRARTMAALQQAASGEESGEVVGETENAAASETEVLRHRDIARLSESDRRRLAEMFGGLRPVTPLRRATRRRPSAHGDVDAARTLRASLRRMGEPAIIEWRRRGLRPRKVVLLLDVSGSMSAYADAQLRLAHRMVSGGSEARSARSSTTGAVEVFTLGTRLTRVTRALRQRDPERALAAAGETVPDWSGGTRLGETLKAFLDTRRDLARGAVVAVVSDGWERGDAALLGEQLARLSRLAHRVVWANPHRGKDGYEPVQAGIAAALPHIDALVAGHSLASYQQLLEVIARA